AALVLPRVRRGRAPGAHPRAGHPRGARARPGAAAARPRRLRPARAHRAPLHGLARAGALGGRALARPARAPRPRQAPRPPGLPEPTGPRHAGRPGLGAWVGARGAGPRVTRGRDEALAPARELHGRAVAGEPFAELARRWSDDSSAPRGGRLGVYRTGTWAP